MSKSPMDLESNPIINLSGQKTPELPIRTTTKILTQTEGRGLKQNTRTTPGLVNAVMFGFAWVQRWGDDYVGNMLDDLMCLAISRDGKGREEQIECLRAGGSVPDAYYGGKPSRNGVPGYQDTAYVRGNIQDD